jgi:hypothetical protein
LVLGASLQDVEREVAARHHIELGPTVSRSVRGSMGELTFAVEDELHRGQFPAIEELQLYLSTYIWVQLGCATLMKSLLSCCVTRESSRRWFEIDDAPFLVWEREVQ